LLDWLGKISNCFLLANLAACMFEWGNEARSTLQIKKIKMSPYSIKLLSFRSLTSILNLLQEMETTKADNLWCYSNNKWQENEFLVGIGMMLGGYKFDKWNLSMEHACIVQESIIYLFIYFANPCFASWALRVDG
jgi:hypothetical protein